jgi:hypothetical protein
MVRAAEKRRRFAEAARQYSLTRRWEGALEPLSRCYGGLAASPIPSRIATPAMVCR